RRRPDVDPHGLETHPHRGADRTGRTRAGERHRTAHPAHRRARAHRDHEPPAQRVHGWAFHFSEAAPEPLSSTLLFTIGIGAAGCVFAAVAAVTAQLSPFARAASGMAGAVLTVSFVIRGIGDMS